MEVIRNTFAVILLIIGAIAVVFVGPAMGMYPGMWIVMGGMLCVGTSCLIAAV